MTTNRLKEKDNTSRTFINLCYANSYAGAKETDTLCRYAAESFYKEHSPIPCKDPVLCDVKIVTESVNRKTHSIYCEETMKEAYLVGYSFSYPISFTEEEYENGINESRYSIPLVVPIFKEKNDDGTVSDKEFRYQYPNLSHIEFNEKGNTERYRFSRTEEITRV